MAAILATLDEAKRACRVEHDLSDDEIQAILDACEARIAGVCGVEFTCSSRTERLDGGAVYLKPLVAPIVSITSITDVFSDEALDTDYYEHDGSMIFGRSDATYKLPRLFPSGRRRWEVVYLAGYNDGNEGTTPEGSEAAPAGYKAAILSLVRLRWHSRTGVTSESVAGGSSLEFASEDDVIASAISGLRRGSWF